MKEKVKEKTIDWASFEEELRNYFLPSGYRDFVKEELRDRKRAYSEPVISYVIDGRDLI